ncbi:ImmA/IrrE family metallo-endopeptidase [Marinobacter shengliensis]|uniref:ImmA/IrrE family metallo-endopeptidase n=1 Tax=Marinobacter shengliensis TaxID=1389223 RepID=UPI000D10CAD5|nr:ImmA/IrrE family metallo-endopeptidase [Marinobacter shengliensis]PSF12409.1 hypothetical protein C7H10_09230 [Marinobacter shengliensis]
MTSSKAVKFARKALEFAWDKQFPVDPKRIAAGLVKKEDGKDFKIVVETKSPFDEELGSASGYAEFREGTPGSFVCAYNGLEPPYRNRFTIAHELGHVLLGHVAPGKKRKRDTTFNSNGDWDEVDANAFAAELLMPEAYVREKAKTMTDISDLASFFGVSPTAIKNRLKNLGIL